MSRAKLVGEDFDDLYFFLEGGFLDNDEDFHIQLDNIVSEISSDEGKTGWFKCKHCEKVCVNIPVLAQALMLDLSRVVEF